MAKIVKKKNFGFQIGLKVDVDVELERLNRSGSELLGYAVEIRRTVNYFCSESTVEK